MEVKHRWAVDNHALYLVIEDDVTAPDIRRLVALIAQYQAHATSCDLHLILDVSRIQRYPLQPATIYEQLRRTPSRRISSLVLLHASPLLSYLADCITKQLCVSLHHAPDYEAALRAVGYDGYRLIA